jgi:hypothetical protein
LVALTVVPRAVSVQNQIARPSAKAKLSKAFARLENMAMKTCGSSFLRERHSSRGVLLLSARMPSEVTVADGKLGYCLEHCGKHV